MAQADPALTGETINGYRIVQKLGSGGMGLVFRAVDTRLNRHVALKFLPEDLEVNERARALLVMEAQAASALDHPNVGTIYGMEQTPGGRMFIVMAFYNGQTLAEKIAAAGPIAADETIRIALQITDGLAEAHAQHIVHRDIKPSNVILTPQGGVKILDFGLARVLSSASVTQSIGLAGTVAYMSPQQVLGRAIDQRTDLWSLGVTMYEMLTGRLPFEADSSASMLMAIVHHAPRELDATVPSALQKVVYRLLVKEAAERYQETSAVQGDLKGAAETKASARVVTQSELNRLRSLVARPLVLTTRTFSSVERWSIAGLCLLLVAVIGLAFALMARKGSGVSATGVTQHIAVLPLEAKDATVSDSEVSEGLRESITDRLSNLQAADRSLWVVPASEVSAHKVSTPGEAKKAYGANLVVLGRLARQGSVVRLRLELVDSSQLRQLGAVDAENADGNLSSLEDSAVQELESKLGLPPVNSDREKTAVAPTAYSDYLKALPLLDRWDKPNSLEAATSLLKAAVQRDGNFPLAYASLANADLIRYHLTTDKSWLDQAATNCNHALQLNAQLPAVHVTMGKIQDANGRYDLGLQEFERALQLEPHSADATFGIASVYEHEGRTKDAEAAFRNAVALRPDYFDSYDKLGEFYRRHQRMPEAIQQFRHAIQLAPDSRAPYVNLGAALIDDGHTDEAIEALKKASAIAPSYNVSANLGVIYLQQRRFAEAEKATEEALELNPRDWRVWTNLAAILRWRKQEARAAEAQRRAVPLMQNAIRVQPQDAEVRGDLAMVYADLGKDKEARQQLESALALGPGNGAVEATSAAVLERLGDGQRAVAMLHQAMKDGVSMNDLALDPDMQTLLSDRRLKASRRAAQPKTE